MKTNATKGAKPIFPMGKIGRKILDDYFQAHWGVLIMPETGKRAVAFTNLGVDNTTKAIIKAFKAKMKAKGVAILDEQFVKDGTEPDAELYTWFVVLDSFDRETIRDAIDSSVEKKRNDPFYFRFQQAQSIAACDG